MMNEAVIAFGFVDVLALAVLGTLWARLTALERAFERLINASEGITDPKDMISDAIGEIEDGIQETVSNVMEQMRVPTIADHLGGMLAQWGQMKLMKEAENMGLNAPALEQDID
jgi:hypothetical protein